MRAELLQELALAAGQGQPAAARYRGRLDEEAVAADRGDWTMPTATLGLPVRFPTSALGGFRRTERPDEGVRP